MVRRRKVNFRSGRRKDERGRLHQDSLRRHSSSSRLGELCAPSPNLLADLRLSQPCVRVSKVALFPIEVVDLQGGQKYARKLDPTQTAESLKLTTIAPANRVPLLRQGIDSIRPTTTGSP